ncbi:MAG: hypothetical protein JWN52_7082 [Actinomycetia bacterium]|nr:hypothetical protein [Actinomycetes bacterium]
MSSPDLSQLAWRKSSHSNEQGGTCVELATKWRKSSHSSEQGGTCVEVAAGRAVPVERLILVRDSKNSEGPVLSFAGVAWASFARELKDGRYVSLPNHCQWRMRHLVLVTLVVRDYDEAIAYYVDVLGFELIEDTRLDTVKRWVVVAPRGAR